MLRNVLLLVEQTPSGQVARKVAADITAQGSCNLTALKIIEPDSPTNNEDMAASPHRLFVDELNGVPQPDDGAQRTDDEDYFSALKVDYRTKLLRGPKYAVLCRELEKNDFAVIGRDGNFAEHWDHDAKEIINLLLEYRARPIIITSPVNPEPNNNVLITYDGSPGSCRAAQLFVLMGLARNRSVHVLSVSRKKNMAQACADSLTSYLNNHRIDALPHAVSSREDPRSVIVDMIRETGSSLVVAGAFGSSGWKRSLFGSVGDYLIRYCPVPLFSCQ